MIPLYDWDYPWFNANPTKKTTPSSSTLHYFSGSSKPGYRRINCLVNDKNDIH